jgi:hypothetical protein
VCVCVCVCVCVYVGGGPHPSRHFRAVDSLAGQLAQQRPCFDLLPKRVRCHGMARHICHPLGQVLLERNKLLTLQLVPSLWWVTKRQGAGRVQQTTNEYCASKHTVVMDVSIMSSVVLWRCNKHPNARLCRVCLSYSRPHAIRRDSYRGRRHGAHAVHMCRGMRAKIRSYSEVSTRTPLSQMSFSHEV